MPIQRINEFPEGSGSLSNDDIFLFMDDPSGSGITKKISLSQISSSIGGGGGGNPFDQDLNTTNFPEFSGVSLNNGTTLAQGTFDNSTGGQGGISLNCYVGYELNWQGGHLKNTQDNGVTTANIICDSPIEFPGSGIDNVEMNSSGIRFSDGTNQTSAFNNSAISGILSTNIVSGTGVSLVYNAIANSLTVNSNGLIPVVDLGTLTGTNAINGGISNAFQKITLNGTSVTFTKGTGWPTNDSLLIDSILKITATSGTSITWSIVNEWYNQPPAGALASGVHLFGLRAVGSGIIEGHYIGNKTN
jgi:hypothetical protein